MANSDAILRELNRLVNDRSLNHSQRRIVHQTIQHIKLQDDELLELRDDLSDWRDPDGDPPPEAA